MMNLCLEYTGKELLKMYPTITKFEAKELTKLGEKHGKTLPNRLKHQNEDNIPPKWQHHQRTKKQPMGMPLARLIPLKEKKIYDLNNNEDFSFVKTVKIGKLTMYFHF